MMSWLFARNDAVSEAVITPIRFNSRPEAVWNHFLFYEEVPGRAPFLLRTLLTQPLRTEGNKDCVGATIRCQYASGELIKRVTTLEPFRLLEFAVVEQRLGIEDCLLTRGGSFQIETCGEQSDVVLVTNYLAYLRPRFLWRVLEALLVHQLHHHILRGVAVALLSDSPTGHQSAGNAGAQPCTPAGGIACTVSPSSSRH
jgi:hypothetical protein